MIEILENFSGYIVNGIEAKNDGDITNYFVCKELIKKTVALCIDIGADKGAWSETISELDPTRKIYLFEPNPISFQALPKKNPNHTAFPYAISDCSGLVPFELDGPQSFIKPSGVPSIEARTLESFVGDEPLGLVKIDTEGHDLKIMESMMPMFEKGQVHSVISEFTPRWYGTSYEMCYENSLDHVKKMNRHFPYMYALSRNGAPYLVDPLLALEEFIEDHTAQQFQTDLLFTKEPITSLPVVPFEVGKWYA